MLTLRNALLTLFATLFLFSCDTLKEVAEGVLSEPTAEEVGKGLREALSNGAVKASDVLSKPDGYLKSVYKILLPEEARKVTDRLKGVPGFSNLETELLERINRGAEDAAKEAGPIFLDAIRQMTIRDATNILMGQDNAATEYLKKSTSNALYAKFDPKITASLDKIGANNLWKKATDAYNSLPMVNKINNDLSDYVTQEALKGLFSKVGEEEKNIRRNKLARTSEILKKVFAKQDTNRK
ncbi:MAG TPA: DUF4197 domain-containing protein [Saprospiraceae bacterium]|nr:DUF4197 domain-containing protein [Saprospiraceae bacterium]HNG90165.1 DUF4197 domain-containing protein [Saprospiraceae bacterium]